METKLKIGDKIICHKACIMDDDNKKETTIGNFYEIKKIRPI